MSGHVRVGEPGGPEFLNGWHNAQDRAVEALEADYVGGKITLEELERLSGRVLRGAWDPAFSLGREADGATAPERRCMRMATEDQGAVQSVQDLGNQAVDTVQELGNTVVDAGQEVVGAALGVVGSLLGELQSLVQKLGGHV